MTGIVLAGGQSSRMGQDKGLMTFRNRPLVKIATDRLAACCDDVFISVNQQQAEAYQSYGNLIIDQHEDEGPLGGILSVFEQIEGPLLITAVDLPLLSETELKRLLAHRSPESLVTAFFDQQENRWEALVSLWEPQACDRLIVYFSEKKRSVQRFLNEIHARKVEVVNPEAFVNVNAQGDWEGLGFSKSIIPPTTHREDHELPYQ